MIQLSDMARYFRDQELTGARAYVAGIVEHKHFTNFIAWLIVIHAITLGIETDRDIMARYGDELHLFDAFVLAIFVIELLLKLYAYRLPFFKSGWNVFDFVIVGLSILPSLADFTILRSLRVLRILRLISVVPQMRSVIGALFHAIPGMASIIGILMVLLYVAAVFATQIFGQNETPELQLYFGTIGNSMYTMFQLMTLEDWPDIASPTIEQYPWAWAFFIPYIVITTFAVLNLFIGIIVDALNIVKENEAKEKESQKTDLVVVELQSLRAEIEELKKVVQSKRSN